jgi:uncharacterized protein YutE (UPF0331/DUF86 family)
MSTGFVVSSLGGASVTTPVTIASSVGARFAGAGPTATSSGLSGNTSTFSAGFTFLGSTGGVSVGITGVGAGVAASMIRAPTVPTAPTFASSVWPTVPAPPSLGSTAFAPPLAGARAGALVPQYSGGDLYDVKMENRPPIMQGSFDLYAEELKTFLTNMDIWGVVEDAATVRAIVGEEHFRRMNNLARGAILRGVPKADAELICHQQSAQDMWSAFVDKQTKREYANYIFARQRLIANAYTPEKNMNDSLREMQLYRNELMHYKRGVSDEEFAEILLGNVVQTHRDVVRQFSRHFDPGFQRSTPSSAQVMNALRAESELDARLEDPQQGRDISSARAGRRPNQQEQGRGRKRGRGKSKAKGGNQKQGRPGGKQGVRKGEDKRKYWNCHDVGHIHANCPNPKRDDDESDSQLPERKR